MASIVGKPWFLPAISIVTATTFVTVHLSNDKGRWRERPELNDGAFQTGRESDGGGGQLTDEGGMSAFTYTPTSAPQHDLMVPVPTMVVMGHNIPELVLPTQHPGSASWNIPLGQPTPDPAQLQNPDTPPSMIKYESPLTLAWNIDMGEPTPDPALLNDPATPPSLILVQGSQLSALWNIPLGQPTPDPALLNDPATPPYMKKSAPFSVIWNVPLGQPTPDPALLHNPATPPSLIKVGTPPPLVWNIPLGQPTPDPALLHNPATPPYMTKGTPSKRGWNVPPGQPTLDPALIKTIDAHFGNYGQTEKEVIGWNIPAGEPTPDPAFLPPSPPVILQWTMDGPTPDPALLYANVPSELVVAMLPRPLEIGTYSPSNGAGMPGSIKPTISTGSSGNGSSSGSGSGQSSGNDPSSGATYGSEQEGAYSRPFGIGTEAPSTIEQFSPIPPFHVRGEGPQGRPPESPPTPEPTGRPVTLSPTKKGETRTPSAPPTIKPFQRPTWNPTRRGETRSPVVTTPKPTRQPTPDPTQRPVTLSPTRKGETRTPTKDPTPKPTRRPTPEPTPEPSRAPITLTPTREGETRLPTYYPTPKPTHKPTKDPTPEPTQRPVTLSPTRKGETRQPTEDPTPRPTRRPTPEPTNKPVVPTRYVETKKPTPKPSFKPTTKPVTHSPTNPDETREPSMKPTGEPTELPSPRPSPRPTTGPTPGPTAVPTALPTSSPTQVPVVASVVKPEVVVSVPQTATAAATPWWNNAKSPTNPPTPSPVAKKHNEKFLEGCDPTQCIYNETAAFHSMSSEDESIYELFYSNPIKCCLVFVEIGAGDGNRFSTSKFFEDGFKARSLLIEASPDFSEELQANRPNAATELGAFCESGHMLFDKGNFHSLGGSVEVSSELHSSPTSGSATQQQVPCLKMESIFSKYGITKVDVMVVRVRGDALAFIRSMDWTIRVDIWIVLMHDHQDRDQLVKSVLKNNEYIRAEWDVKRWCSDTTTCLNNEVFLRKGFDCDLQGTLVKLAGNLRGS